jgi:hypothetical protein
MRENIPFDDFVKKQFSDYSPEVPSHIWENIVSAKRSTKPKGFWMSMSGGAKFLLFALLLAAGGGALYIYSGKNAAPGNEVKNISPVQKTDPAQKINNTDNSIPQNKNNNQARSIIDPSSVPDKKNDVTEQPGNSISPSETFVTKTPGEKNNRYNATTDPKEKQVIYREKQFNNGDSKELTTTVTIENNLPSQKQISLFRFNNARELNVKKIPGTANVKLPDCPTLEKNAAGNKQYWEVYGGPDYAIENYKSYGDTTSANYLEKRKASTKFASAFSAGVRYTKVFNNGTSIRAGLNYTQVNEKFIFFNPNEIKFITVITTRVVIRAPGDTIYINDTLQYQQSGTRIKTTLNRYRNIDVPLVIGYELGNGKIHANINAGVIINVYSWYKGDVLDSLYQPVSITTGKSNSIYQFKNNIGVGFLGSVSLYYKMSDKMHLVIEPYFRYNLSPMSKQNLNLQQKYNVAGLRAGIRMDLK